MGMKGKESICQIKGTPGLDNEALEVNMRAMLRAQPYVSKTFRFHTCPRRRQKCKRNVSRILAGRHRDTTGDVSRLGSPVHRTAMSECYPAPFTYSNCLSNQQMILNHQFFFFLVGGWGSQLLAVYQCR